MSWVASEAEFRIFNPETGIELYIDSGGSDGSKSFRLSGPAGCYHFTAYTVFPKLSDSEKIEEGIASRETWVWQVFNWNSHWRQEIKEALLTFKSASGFHYPGAVYFVQFGLNGELESA